MAFPAIPVLAAGLGLLLAAGGRRRRRTSVCNLAVASVSLEDVDEQDRWIRCADRTQAEAQALADRLTAAGRSARAAAVTALWSRRRAVEESRPDGTVTPPIRAQIDQALTTTDAEAQTLPVTAPPETVIPAPHGTTTAAPTRRGASSSRSTTSSSRSTSSSSSRPSSSSSSSRSTPSRSSAIDYANPARSTPAGFDASRARSTAPGVVACLRSRTPSDCRRRVTQFQRYAGIPADGSYGPLTFAALRAFGADPPATSGAARTYIVPGGGVVLPAPSSSAPLPAPVTDAPPLRPAEPFGHAVDSPSYVMTSTAEHGVRTPERTAHLEDTWTSSVTHGPELPHPSGPTGTHTTTTHSAPPPHPAPHIATHVSAPSSSAHPDAPTSVVLPSPAGTTSAPTTSAPTSAPDDDDEPAEDPTAHLPPRGMDPPPVPTSGPNYGSIRVIAEAARDAVTTGAIAAPTRRERLRAFQTAYNSIVPRAGHIGVDGTYGAQTRRALSRTLGVPQSEIPAHAAAITRTAHT